MYNGKICRVMASVLYYFLFCCLRLSVLFLLPCFFADGAIRSGAGGASPCIATLVVGDIPSLPVLENRGEWT